jgi:hypothetical protein
MLVSVSSQVVAIGNRVNAISNQNVIVGRRSAAIGSQLMTVQSLVKTRFGDIENIVKGLSGKGAQTRR